MGLNPRIISVDRLRDGLIVTFNDGASALYPARFLRELLPRARALGELPNADGEDDVQRVDVCSEE